ncbi:putative DNA-binding protein [Nocardia transvalensis]|uniref:Putative DNA-binding protein n=1 Tax=Nocardia transvalensis TaxID=37333 RepID=A0A7W9PJ24_9NOCA|nr:hypothetical protein [Nocardia transvalensis]MBB5916992.1 putative DNA-binding protein [Nocardia transvalensis]
MSDKDLPSSPQEVTAFLDRLTFDGTAPADQVPPPLRPDEDIMITSSIRLPLRLHARLKELASERGIGLSTLVREWLEASIAELDDDQLISRAEARMALARLHPARQAG